MLIFGTAGKQRVLTLDDQHVLLYVYRYFHIFWLLRLAYGGRYELASMTEQGWAHRPVSTIEAEQMAGPNLPKKSLWDQWSLPAALAILFLCTILPSMTMRSS